MTSQENRDAFGLEGFIPDHRYLHRLRPPDMGCQPNGFTKLQQAREIRQVGDYTIPCRGWAEYAEPLTFEQVWKYDLFPEDVDEAERYQQWRDQNNK